MESGYSMCRTLPDRRNALKPFTAWLEDLGARMEGVEVADFGEQGLGLRTNKDLTQGEPVIRIPRKAMMTTDTARASSIGTLIERDPLLQTMPNVVLAVHLLIERNSPASLWEPYINTLPHSYSTVLYFSKEQVKLFTQSLYILKTHFKFAAGGSPWITCPRRRFEAVQVCRPAICLLLQVTPQLFL